MRLLSISLVFAMFLAFGLESCHHAEDIGLISKEEMQKESAKSNEFFDRSFDEALSRDPERETMLGIKKDYDKWTDHSETFAQKEYEIAKKELDELHKEIDIEKLNDQARLSYRYFEYN